MANLLIVDASSSLCSVALLVNDRVISQEERQPRRHAQRLLPLIDDILQQGGIGKQQLDGVAFGRGPGSFTGIRIALSLVQGMTLGLGIPVLGVSSLEMLAAARAGQDGACVAAVMNAHMGEVFWGRYRMEQGMAVLIGEERVGSPEQCVQDLADFEGEWLGSGVPLLKASLADESAIETLSVTSMVDDMEPLASFVVSSVSSAWEQGKFSGIENHPPVYLRDSVAWKKLDEQPSLLKR